jgi:adapter protein MecA 1/2
MKMERLTADKIRIFLTYDDLVERGIHKEDLWREIPKVHELFSDMMDQAYSELGFDVEGPLAVEVFMLPSQGMVIIVTRGGQHHPYMHHDEHGFDEDDEDVYEMEVTLERSDTISYAFDDFENVIRAVHMIKPHVPSGGSLFAYRGVYVLQFEPEDLREEDGDKIVSLLSEFGEATSVTRAVLEEYGKTVEHTDAIGAITRYFA